LFMEVLKLTGYESAEDGAAREVFLDTETRAASFKHNKKTGLFADRVAPRLAASPRPTEIMATDGLTAAETGSERTPVVEGHELDAFLGKAFDERPIWSGLWESVRDVFFPVKLPPLELTSTPIPVPDRMAVKANPWAIGLSSSLNISVLLLAIWLGIHLVQKVVTQPLQATNIDVGDWNAPKDTTKAGGGGGGGDRSPIDANKGKLPEKIKDPITPPQAQSIVKPLLPEPAAINVQKDIQLPNNDMPMIGMKSSTNVILDSNGQGSSAGMGTGGGGGLGSGSGNGYGPGEGGNAGGGLFQIGGRVSAPMVIHSVEAEFSDEARRAKYQGVCLISLIVDAQGNPQNIRVARPLGMGLDEKAIEAIRQYKFRPAMKDGKNPVPVMITIEVDFRLY